MSSSHVQRLDQIHPGDRVKVTYYEALAAQVVNVRSPTSQPFEGVSVNRTETASRPGGEVTRVRSGRVTITDVDPATNTVSFVGPDGLPRTVTARNPQVQSFIRSLACRPTGGRRLRGGFGNLGRTHALVGPLPQYCSPGWPPPASFRLNNSDNCSGSAANSTYSVALTNSLSIGTIAASSVSRITCSHRGLRHE